MARLSLKYINKIYPDGVHAVKNASMEIAEGEFVVFVGPSGCGKSTLLRMIAGLEEISAGDLFIDGRIANHTAPQDRRIAMVFQSYSLYPYLHVYDNLAFGLKRKYVASEIDRRVREAAEVLGITEHLFRRPKALSGGQRQRVALGRAIVTEPALFLLDEPLSNLDAKLRADMRAEIIKLHDRLKTTFVYVTHDQMEAMTMADRIVVLKDGVVQQIDTPKDLYAYPCNRFVAEFVGTPQMNLFAAKLQMAGEQVAIASGGECTFFVPYNYMDKISRSYLDGTRSVAVGIRPEDIRIGKEYEQNQDYAVLEGSVGIVEELGGESLIHCDIEEKSPGQPAIKRTMIIKSKPEHALERGASIRIALDKRKLHFFDADSGQSIRLRIPEENTVWAELTGTTLRLANCEIALPPAVMSQIPDLKGKTEVMLPLTAITLGSGPYEAVIIKNEKVGSVRLLRLDIAGTKLYASGMTSQTKGKILFDLDIKQLRIRKDIAEALPLPQENTLPAKLIKQRRDASGKQERSARKQQYKEARRKEREGFSERCRAWKELKKGGNSKKAGPETAVLAVDADQDKQSAPVANRGKEVLLERQVLAEYRRLHKHALAALKKQAKEGFFDLLTGEARLRIPHDCAKRIHSALGKQALKIPLTIAFPPDALSLAPDGLAICIEHELDYGKETFWRGSYRGQWLTMLCTGEAYTPGRYVRAAIDPARIRIFTAESGMQIL